MLYCKKCNVKVRTNHKYCPLCQSPLGGEAEEDDQLFPDIDERIDTSGIMIQIFNFLCCAIIIVVFMANWMMNSKDWWAVWVAGGVLCMWVFFTVGLYKRKNLMKNAMWQLCLITVGTIIWDVAIGWRGWSINYVMPIAGLITMAVMIIIAIIAHLTSPEYMIYFLMNCLHGLIPCILVLTDQITVIVPSIIYVGCCALFLSALIIFQGKAVWSELQKKFHM
ncbi:MAG: DUF6320 domain-containing protein [Candidatus Fimimorpha sp.]